jgi:hypothetical protein
VIGIGKFAVLEFDSLILRQEGYSGHTSIVTSR